MTRRQALALLAGAGGLVLAGCSSSSSASGSDPAKARTPSGLVAISGFIGANEHLDATGNSAGDNATILQRALDALQSRSQPARLYVPPGRYRLSTTLKPRSNAGLQGANADSTVLLSPASAPAFKNDGSFDKPITDWFCGDLTVDCSAQHSGQYDVGLKAFVGQFYLRPHFENVTVRNSWATGFGVDYLQDYVFKSCHAIGCGRGVSATGTNPFTAFGSAGFGIGTGVYPREAGQVIDCTATDCNRGIFWEQQDGFPHLAGGVSMTGFVAQRCFIGFQDCGCDGLTGDITITDCHGPGMVLDHTLPRNSAGRNGDVRVTINGCGTDADPRLRAGLLLGVAGAAADAMSNYTVRGTIANTHGPGVLAGPTVRGPARLGTGIRILADVTGNQGPGVLIASGTTAVDGAPVRNLQLVGAVTGNGTTASSQYRDGVTIAVGTTGLSVTGQVSANRGYGIELLTPGQVLDAATISGSLRGNAAGALHSEQTIAKSSVITAAGYTPGH